MKTQLVAVLFLFSIPASAETIVLIDGTKMSGEIVHSFRGEYTIATPQGEIVLPKAKIKSITFEKPVARAIYSSPEKTLDARREAAKTGDEKAMLDAYALMYQGMVAQEMDSMDFKTKSRMIADVTTTKFTIKKSDVQKEKAV